MLLRCVIDGLLLPALLEDGNPPLWAFDGDEGFQLEAVEAVFYEIVRASPDELLALERAPYRLLRRANDFHWTPRSSEKMTARP
jgi:hypothetical protein